MTNQPATTASGVPGVDTPGRVQPPPPGLYDGILLRDYHAWDCASNSRLSDLIDRSPAFCRYVTLQPNESEGTPEVSIGTAGHALSLQPDEVDALFVVAQQCSAITGKGLRCSNPGAHLRRGQWWCNIKGHTTGERDGDETRLVVAQAIIDTAQRIRDSVWADPDARALLENARREVSGIWVDPTTGETCKFRPDAWDLTGRVISDLKCVPHSEAEFRKMIDRLRLYRQASWYSDGGRHTAPLLGAKPPEAFCWIAAEPTPPHEVAVYECDNLTRIAGGFEMDAALTTYHRCRTSGFWPTRPPGTPKIGLPEYALKRLIPDDRSFEA